MEADVGAVGFPVDSGTHGTGASEVNGGADVSRPPRTKAFRNDAVAKVTGRAKYCDDLKKVGLLHAVPVYADFVHAQLNAIHTEEASRMPGVIRVVTAGDVEAIGGKSTFSYIIPDHRMLVGVGDKIRCHSDVVALVVATSRQEALAASKVVSVDATPLPPIIDPEEALKRPSGFVHEGNLHEGKPSNVVNHYKVRHGQGLQAFESCDQVIQHTFRTQYHEHAYLEPESALAELRPDGVMEVVGSMQHPFSTRRFVTAILGKSLSDVEVRTIPMGGGFGGKDDTAAIVCARVALCARLTHRPVKLTYTREWSMRESYKRHPYVLHYRMGLKGQRIHAMEVEIIADAGAYCSATPWVTFRSTAQCCGPYVVPNVHCDVYGVYTNNVFTGAYRGFGSPQVNYAIEQLVDMAADKVGLSPLEFRRLNMVRQGSITVTGQRLDNHVVSLPEALNRTLTTMGYEEKFQRCSRGVPADKDSDELYGIGFAMSYRGMSLGGEGSDFNSAILNMNFDGSIFLEAAIHENGQGAESAFLLIAAKELGCDLKRLRYRWPSTSNIPDGGTTVASRGTLMGGGATVIAARQLKEKLARLLAGKLKCRPEEISFHDDRIWSRDDGSSISWEEAGSACYLAKDYPFAFGVFQGGPVSWDEETGQGDAYFTWVYGCQGVEVLVNKKTGKVRVLNMVATHDVGRVINLPMLEGQVYGGMVQGLGYGILEEMKSEGGRLKTLNFNTYRLLRAADLPEMTVQFLETPDPNSPSGAKGIGEPALELMNPAVANAICNATGIRFFQSPLTPDRILKAFNDQANLDCIESDIHQAH